MIKTTDGRAREQRKIKFLRSIGPSEDQAKRMLGDDSIQSAYRAMRAQAGLNVKSFAAIRKNQFHRSAAFPVRSLLEGVGIDSIFRSEDAFHRGDEAEGGNGKQCMGEAIAG